MQAMEYYTLKYRLKWLEHKDYIFCDIAETSFERVVKYVMEHMAENTIYQALGVWSEPKSVEVIRKYLFHLLENETSIMVITKDGMEIKAVVLMLLTTKEHRSWTNLEMMAGWTTKLRYIIGIRRLLHDEYVALQKWPDFDSMVIHEFIIEPDFLADRFIMNRLYQAIVQSSRHMTARRVTHVIWEQKYQRIPRLQGWKVLTRFIYSMYIEKGERPLDILRKQGEVAAILFEIQLKPITPYYEMPGYEEGLLKRQTQKAKEEQLRTG